MTIEKEEKINLEELGTEEELQEEESQEEEILEEKGEKLSETPLEEPSKEEKPVNIDDLNVRLEEMERVNKGLKQGITNIRSEKQTLAAKLDQLAGVIMSAQQQREEGQDKSSESSRKIKMEITDAGEVYLNPDDLAPILKQTIQPIQQTTDLASKQITQMDQNQALQAGINSVVSQKDEYQQAYQNILIGFNAMNEAAKSRAIEQGADPNIVNNVDVAASVLYGTDFENQLAEKGLNIDDLVFLDKVKPQMFPVCLERIMKKMTKKSASSPSLNRESLEKMAGKKSNLVGKRSSSSSDEGLTLDNIANTLTAMDLLKLPDKKFKELMEVAEE